MDDLTLYLSNEKSLKSLIQTRRVFSNDIGMGFRVEKCAVMTMKKGKMANSDGITLPNKTKMKGLKEGDSYKSLGEIQTCNDTRRNEGKRQNRVVWTTEKDTRNKIEWWIYNNRNKYKRNFINKILCYSTGARLE